MLLQYDEEKMTVVNFMIIHHSYITENVIEARKPLSENAKRAGWQGCMINISNVPAIAKLIIVEDGFSYSNELVMQKWRSSDFINKVSVVNIGWFRDLLNIIDMQEEEFSLGDIYKYEAYLISKYPKNNNIKAKIRQLLQVIRDQGVILFVGKGMYRKI